MKSKAIPATVCGTANGTSTIVSTNLSNFPKLLFDIKKANGTPNTRETTAVMKERDKLFQKDIKTLLSFKTEAL